MMKSKEFTLIIKGNQVRYEKDNFEMSQALGVSERTFKRYKANVENMKIADLKILIKQLHIQDTDILSFLKG